MSKTVTRTEFYQFDDFGQPPTYRSLFKVADSAELTVSYLIWNGARELNTILTCGLELDIAMCRDGEVVLGAEEEFVLDRLEKTKVPLLGVAPAEPVAGHSAVSPRKGVEDAAAIPNAEEETQDSSDKTQERTRTQESEPVAAPAEFHGSNFSYPLPGVMLGCITPEASDLIHKIMVDWEVHKANLKEQDPNYEPTHYAMAYWLVRWSGLIEPKRQ